MKRWLLNLRMLRSWWRDDQGVLSIKHHPVTLLHIPSEVLEELTGDLDELPAILRDAEHTLRRQSIRAVK